MDSRIEPLSLANTDSLIEKFWPTGKISAEVQKERKAVFGQTLTSIGSYWKGRKPLFLVRACILGALLPVTDNPKKDLEILEKLLFIDDAAFKKRVKKKADWPAIKSTPYDQRMSKSYRPEELKYSIHANTWKQINLHLGTSASSITDLVEQLGIMRFGSRPKIADTFSGSGSIPFEAARVGCHVYASDLNPVACMLTWGSFNIIGKNEKNKQRIQQEQLEIASSVNEYITKLNIEHDIHGNRAKAYLYCVEIQCPQTGWMVPLLPSLIISKQQKTVAILKANKKMKRYDIEIVSGVDNEMLTHASKGTICNGFIVHPENPNPSGIPISTIRGDYKGNDGKTKNRLRPWNKTDFMPSHDDIFQERLYCVQWIKKNFLNQRKRETFFAKPTSEDLQQEHKVHQIVAQHIVSWQKHGFIPDMPINEGKNTSQPKWERGWTYWHHLFNPRQLLLLAAYMERSKTPEASIFNAKSLDWNAKVCNWMTACDKTNNVFYNQSLNTFYNYACRSFISHEGGRSIGFKAIDLPDVKYKIQCQSAEEISEQHHIYITDPPYADAVNYHEITEFFIAWLKKNPPVPFNQWHWDSHRSLAIKGNQIEFRLKMIQAYKAMTQHMPDNGIQIIMFTHQSGKVWADMIQIFWATALQVIADWYIVTETSTQLKKGNYMKGTHIIVLKKRTKKESGCFNTVVHEIKNEVSQQMETMLGLNQSGRGSSRMENLFKDSELKMAGYAASLKVLTRYTHIHITNTISQSSLPEDPATNKSNIINTLIDKSIEIANDYLVPIGLNSTVWKRRVAIERFYLKMLDIESNGTNTSETYQKFAKAFRVSSYSSLLLKQKGRKPRLKNAQELSNLETTPELLFSRCLTRSILYALGQISNQIDSDIVLSNLMKGEHKSVEEHFDLCEITHYIHIKKKKLAPQESKNARILCSLIKKKISI